MTAEELDDIFDQICKEAGISRQQLARLRDDDPALDAELATCSATFRRSGDRHALVQGVLGAVSSANMLRTARYERVCRQHGAGGLGTVFAASGMTTDEAAARLKQAGGGAALSRGAASHLAAQVAAENYWRGVPL